MTQHHSIHPGIQPVFHLVTAYAPTYTRYTCIYTIYKPLNTPCTPLYTPLRALCVWYALCVEGTAPHRSTRVAVLGAAIEGGRQGDRSGDQWGTGCATKQLLVRMNRVV